MIRKVYGMVLVKEATGSTCMQQSWVIRKMWYAASGAVSVPAACPMRWSTEDHQGYSRTAPQASRPGLMQVGRVAPEI